MPLQKPSTVAQICSSQKDEFYMNMLKGLLSDAAQNIFGPSAALVWSKHITVFADALYFSLTTLSGLQTLGEEYTGIIQVDNTGAATPSWQQRFFMVFGHTIAPFLIERLFVKLENLLSRGKISHLSNKQRDFLLLALPKCKFMFVTLHHLHLSLFYLQNIFHTISKRFSGVHYTKYFTNPPATDKRFHWLGYIQLLQNVAMLSMQIYGLYRDFNRMQKKGGSNQSLHGSNVGPSEKEHYLTETQMSCSLCFETRTFSSATPCGHLFCYYCIHNWMETKQECPVCRQSIEPREIIVLRNL